MSRTCDRVLAMETNVEGKVVDVTYCPNPGDPFCVEHTVHPSVESDYSGTVELETE